MTDREIIDLSGRVGGVESELEGLRVEVRDLSKKVIVVLSYIDEERGARKEREKHEDHRIASSELTWNKVLVISSLVSALSAVIGGAVVSLAHITIIHGG
jgi:hypothetical protein